MTFDISKYHLTGLLIVKQTTTSSVRMVFTNEMGMQFFDLEFTDDRFIVHSIFPSMNKRALLTLLEKDFRMILFQNHNIKKVSILRSKIPETEKYLVRNGHGTFIFIVDTKTKKITGITTHRSILSKTLLSVTHTREGLPNQISIYNPTQKLHINLLLLSD
ncbi:MAG: hypothetical protein NTX61_07735 [Bacteroidetes bacterium]|nr:hypothetical protein [Bacteroidota bacterium]